MSDDESYTNSVEVNSSCTIEQYHMLNSSDVALIACVRLYQEIYYK